MPCCLQDRLNEDQEPCRHRLMAEHCQFTAQGAHSVDPLRDDSVGKLTRRRRRRSPAALRVTENVEPAESALPHEIHALSELCFRLREPDHDIRADRILDPVLSSCDGLSTCLPCMGGPFLSTASWPIAEERRWGHAGARQSPEQYRRFGALNRPQPHSLYSLIRDRRRDDARSVMAEIAA